MRDLAFGIRPLTIAASILFALAACKDNNGITGAPVMPLAGAQHDQASFQPLAAKGKIKHVIIIIQENRSLNNLFYGYPGALTKSFGLDSENQKITLKPISLKTTWDMQHNGQGFLVSCNGTGKEVQGTDCRMNGFDKESCSPKVIGTHCPKSKYLAYSYVPQTETKPYFDMAHQYVLGDQMYASDFDISSFISHQYIIAGVNPKSSVDYPTADWGCPGGPVELDNIAVLLPGRVWLNKHHQSIKTERPCWNPNTLADELDAAKLSWAFYAVPVGAGVAPKYTCGHGGDIGPQGKGSRGSGIWSAYQAIQHICYGPDWATDVAPFAPPSKFLTDIQTDKLRAVTWITPTDANSDHGGSDSAAGPSWVASVVNAIGKSPFWSSCAIFIFWDDPGGWYDPEPPQYLKDSNYDGLGYRLPLLIISPYAKKGYVDHTHYEHGTILKFVENQFGLPPLEDPSDKGASDIRANAPSNAFNFKQAPRKFVPIKAPLNANYFIHEIPDGQPPDSD